MGGLSRAGMAGLGSLAAGNTYGVAKKARVRFLQIADCEARTERDCGGPYCRYRQATHTTVHRADVVEAVDWVTEHGDRPAVALLNYAVASLGDRPTAFGMAGRCAGWRDHRGSHRPE